MYFQEVSRSHSYWCVACLIAISLTNSLQRSSVNYMYTYFSDDPLKQANSMYNIRMTIADFDNEAYALLVGDTMTLIYACFVLFTGSLSDFIDRKLLLCVSCFMWTLCSYMMSFCSTFNQLLILKIIQNFFSAFQGPCSYSLLTDWIRPQERTMAYALYALGV